MTTKTTHTPGPWINEEGRDHTHVVGESAVVAMLPRWPVAADEQEANARLIAAAPEMADTLRNLVLTVEWARKALTNTEFDSTLYMLVSDARALLAKIEGKE